MKIALDVMGGDFAPLEMIAGGLMWQEKAGHELVLVGDRQEISKVLESFNYNSDKISIVHASQVITMNESPAIALRKKPDASIVVATSLVKKGMCDAVVSCGSTGAQMAAAIFILGRLKKVERPPLAALIPSQSGQSSVLMDVGANIDCKPEQLAQFALLGKVYAEILLNTENPRIGLLNNGTEEGKGNALAVETYRLLAAQGGINFIGNVEGRDLFNECADVIVCDGFIGNILLKSFEGIAGFFAKNCIKEFGKIPAIFKKLDYTEIGGSPLLGIDGISVVCHGSSKRGAVCSGLRIAAECLQNNLVNLQKEALKN